MDSSDQQTPDTQTIDVEVRRSPKFWPLVGIGAGLGIVVALISAYTAEPNAEFTREAVAGFLAVFYGLAGVLLACLAYLLLDRVLGKKARRMRAVEIGDSEA